MVKTNLTVTIGIMVALAVVVLLSGCGKPSIQLDTDASVGPGGQVWGEVWVKIPSDSPKGYRLVGDADQDVVVLEHPTGKMALPDQVATGEIWVNHRLVRTPTGTAPVALYHLCLKDGTEIGYYKRRFARTANQ